MLRIGLFGAAGSGKDSLYEAMQRLDVALPRVAFGDTVKQCAAPLLALHGLDSATMTRAEKDRVRPMLEQLGDLCWDLAGKQWLETIPDICVNTRIQRITEAQAWLDAGGVLVEVKRNEPATETERLYIEEMRTLPHTIVYNTGTIEDLSSAARWLLLPRDGLPRGEGLTLDGCPLDLETDPEEFDARGLTFTAELLTRRG